MTRLWLSRVTTNVNDDGLFLVTHHAELSACGEWLESRDIRWRRTPDWCETKEEAEALRAGEVAEIGARILRQSCRLLEAARAIAAKVEV